MDGISVEVQGCSSLSLLYLLVVFLLEPGLDIKYTLVTHLENVMEKVRKIVGKEKGLLRRLMESFRQVTLTYHARYDIQQFQYDYI